MILEIQQQKFGQIWIIQSRGLCFFKVLINFLYAALSGGTELISVMSHQYNCLMKLYTHKKKKKLFKKKNVRAKMIVHHENVVLVWYLGRSSVLGNSTLHYKQHYCWVSKIAFYSPNPRISCSIGVIELGTIEDPRKLKNCEILYTKSMESCSHVISQILAEFRLERATYKTLHN